MLVLLLLFVVTTWLPAQEKTIETLRSGFEKYRNETLTEKIYAHLDRSFYLTGETLWFKLYATDGTLHQPLDMSKVAYVELISDAGVAVLQAKIELTHGRGAGSLFLPASLTTGNYRFRVYTNWMKNFPAAYYYHEVISIANPFFTPDHRPVKAAATCRAEFFPEGGNLVSGIPARIAFRVTDHTGKGSHCGGVIETTAGEPVASFKTSRFGLGHFTMTPQYGTTYRAVLMDEKGGRHVQPLPQVFESGYTMSLRDSSDFVSIVVETSGVKDDRIFLFVHARKIIAHAAVKTLEHNKATFVVNKNELAEGISHITIFNADLQPVCERLYFTWPKQQLEISVAASQKNFAPRKKVSVTIQTTVNDQPVGAKSSIAVYRIDSLSSGERTGIVPYLWLTSDLSGNIESPEYYFTNPGPNPSALMDDLMLTHGWRRFEWGDILSERPPLSFLPEVREHIVTATVSAHGQRQERVFVYLGSPGKIIRAYGAWTNGDGDARFEIKDFYGPRRLIVQTDTDSARTYDLEIADPFSKQYDNTAMPPLVIPENHAAALLTRSIAMQVQDIYYYDEFGVQTHVPVVDSSAFYGQADATYLLDDYTRFPLLEEVMREYVPGVFVRKRKDGFHFLVVDYVGGGILPGDPIVLIDGVPVPDVDDMMRVDPIRVRKLEVVKRPYYLGQSVFSGIISLTTYNGDLGGLKLDPSSLSLDYEGLQLKRVFHKPEYTRDGVNDRMPDQRVLLHWEPDITIGPDGKYQLDFFTSDVPGQYLIVVEGLTDSGIPGSGRAVIGVEE